MGTQAYLRHPTVAGDTIVFVTEDDLWSVGAGGGPAHRLTANPGTIIRPRLSPDGQQVAYVSRDEGVWDAWVMPLDGGAARRLTHFGSVKSIAGWSPDGGSVEVISDHDQPFAGSPRIWSVPVDGGPPTRVDVGPAWSTSHLPGGGRVIGRNAFDPARWKRYRGGRAGDVWIDRSGEGGWARLVELPGNLADPMPFGRRVAFLSDHEGTGNVYSVTPTGRNIERLTDHHDFYARFPSSDGRRIVYQAGADIHLVDGDGARRVEIAVPSSRPQRNRRFMAPGKFVEAIDLHPEGHSLAVTVRGTAYTMPLWEGAVTALGEGSGTRERLATWHPDGAHLVAVTDSEGEERLVVRSADGSDDARLIDADIGRARTIDIGPRRDGNPTLAAITNHRHEVLVVDLDAGTVEKIHRSPYFWIGGTAWSPDGRWLAFSARATETSQDIHLYDTRERRLHRIGDGRFVDHAPVFTPDGAHLLYLSSRVFDPVPDSVFHDYGFPTSTVVMMAPLEAATSVPFRAATKPLRAPGGNGGSSGDDGEPPETTIELAGIADRAEALPIAAGRLSRLRVAGNRVLVMSHPVRGALGTPATSTQPPKGSLMAFDLTTDAVETVADGVAGFDVSADGKTMAVWNGKKLRVVASTWKDDKSGKETVGRDTGFVDLTRIRVRVDPGDEWRQMFREAWRLQRDHFWSEDMTGVDWLGVHDRYLALVDRVASRSEFSDLLWEMQGELGTSHAYELGGEYRPEPTYTLGKLGADIEWSRGAWRVRRIPVGDSWDPKARSPLARAGVGVREKDRILSIDGTPLSAELGPDALLVDRGERVVSVEVASGRRKPRTVLVEPLKSETALRYRDWVEGNRDTVHRVSDGRCGYIHIPDMGAAGFAEFHRSWRAEVRADGLVVDVRFNRGGNVSQLLLQKLLRERLGFRVMRWRPPQVFPTDAPAGPMVCVTNESSGSDGDIFSHTFKMHGLGPLIGTRTWGGVVGIWPQQSLVDGTLTTQPEFGTWFNDVEYSVENHGTDPDIVVEITPEDHAEGRDPQLDRALDELIELVEAADLSQPEFEPRPSTTPPTLPPR